MKRVLITGAAGFLGSHLCDKFIDQGYEVIGMDNLITGNIKNVEQIFPLKKLCFYHHDMCKFIHILGRIEYTFQFTYLASPLDYLFKQRQPDITRVKAILGWDPNVSR